jgi:penicillin V acylase-like amidase (Ntn superfamily)
MCTRVLWNTNELAVMSGRTMDWPTTTEPRLTVFPRGRERDGGTAGDQVVVADNPLRWTSRYGSLVVSIYGIGAMDGINEAGLAVHGLYLQATSLPTGDRSRPGLHIGLWPQYVLDNAASVAEAVALLDDFDLAMVSARGQSANIHLAIEDAAGESAIIEYIDGERVVHTGREHTVMTNDPAYDEQLQLLAEQDFSHPTREMPLPGNVNARDRFQRAAYYLALLPEPGSEREAAAGVLSVMRNVSVPFGAPYGEFGIYNTEYRTVSDLTHGRYFFELTTSPNVLWVDLDRLDFSPGAPVKTLNPDDILLAGEVSEAFAEQAVAF